MNVNTGKAWSEMDIADLANALTRGTPIEEIADFLCRDVDEVREKVAALAARLDGYL
jgi:ubiquinone biosynthesis protein UbiJ